MKTVQRLVLVCIFFPIAALASVPQDATVEAERIKGVSQFLLERANENFLYIFESKLQNNQYFAYYFPHTHYYAETGHLRTLLRSGGQVWEDSVRADLDCIRDRTIGTILYKTDLYLRGFAEHYVFILQNLKIHIGGKDYRLDFIENGTPRHVIDIINEFYRFTNADSIDAFTDQALGLDLVATGQGNAGNVCAGGLLPAAESLADLEKQMLRVKARADSIKSLVDTIKKYKDQLTLDEDLVAQVLRDNEKLNRLKSRLDNLKQDRQRLSDIEGAARSTVEDLANRISEVEAEISTLREQLKSFEFSSEQFVPLILSIFGEEKLEQAKGDFAKLLQGRFPDHIDTFVESYEKRFYNYITFFNEVKNELEDLQQKCDADNELACNNTVRVIKVEKILQSSVEHHTFQFLARFDQSKFTQLKRYMLFFGEIADAKTAETVQNLLEEITLPPVSFGKKRNPGEEKVLITAYLGGSIGIEDSESNDDPTVGGFFAPIGLEYTFKRSRGYSHSLMLSLLDFGHPINLEIENRDESVQFSDIFVPGIYYSLGLKDIPMTFGFGFNRGQALEGSRRDDNRWLIFVGFDMPLFTVY